MASYAAHCPKLPWMIEFHSTPDGRIQNSQLHAAFADTNTEHLADLNIHSQVPKRKLTGIICTLGAYCDCGCVDEDVLIEMMEAGMTMVRIKMSQFDHDECKAALASVRSANDDYSRKIGRIYPLAIGLDIRGPEIVTGSFHDQTARQIELQQGHSVNITADPIFQEHVTQDTIYVDYKKINEVVRPGDHFYIDDGEIQLSALEVVGSIIRCLIENTGRLMSNASVVLPGVPIDLPGISEKDKADLKFAVDNHVDAVFISGMRSQETIFEARELLGDSGKHIMVISKIDSCQALCNIEEILKASDGILIHRGALGAELPPEKIFLAQKSIIAKCNKAGKPVICSSQILESMLGNTRPTTSEISDTANTILDGADCFLLSKETSIGQHPIESVITLTSICKEAEAAVYQKQVFADLSQKILTPIEPIQAIAIAAVEASLKSNAAVIIVLTCTGRSAKILAKFRPRCPIIAITRFAQVARQLHLFRAIDPIQYITPYKHDWKADVERRIQLGITWGKVSGFIRAGDAIVMVKGSRPGAGFTNSLEVVYASEFDALQPETEIE